MLAKELTPALAAAAAVTMISSPANADELVVSAAISLREAFVEIANKFEHEHRGQKVIFNFGASGQLAQQILRGAPTDVFASASSREINELLQKKLLIQPTVKEFARNKLVVVVPKGNKRITSLSQLANLEKIAIGNPETVPAGKYAQEALTAEKLYSGLSAQHKFVLAESVRQALAYVESGDVDAGLVYSTDARYSAGVIECISISDSDVDPIIYPAAIVSDSKHVQLARSFMDFLSSPAAKSILKSKGYLPADK